ncbi:Sphingomyelin phosphodiesterase 2, neutral membrane (Neutral sphingomyelinase) [Rhizophlyctis rosea]|uniref:sphingomyelin phosphodiesterase n=1 Tax=Rhizophlyctis rosea TaxID=64517 RepID=A0AAD5SEL1_9FUNG|nr:Sphingomyelin phosphodiesterase 2, neutral membrane (Neutral sphingomyelinase) [Rhizophlyctis rosea]
MATDKVRILTLNTFLRPPLIQAPGGDFKEARLSYIITNLLKNYDLIAFQECFGAFTSRRNTLLKAATEKGFTHHSTCPIPPVYQGRVDGGVVVLSRYPIQTTKWFPYPRGVHSDFLADKGLLYTHLQPTPLTNIHIFTTHLQASYHPPGTPNTDESSIQTRLAQIHLIKQHTDSIVKSLSPPYDPKTSTILLVGDLNIDSRSGDEYNLFLSILRGDDTTTQGGKLFIKDVVFDALGEHPITTCSVTKEAGFDSETKCLDYILELVPTSAYAPEETGTAPKTSKFTDTRVDEFKVEGQKWTHASDHKGVMTTLLLSST